MAQCGLKTNEYLNFPVNFETQEAEHKTTTLRIIRTNSSKLAHKYADTQMTLKKCLSAKSIGDVNCFDFLTSGFKLYCAEHG